MDGFSTQSAGFSGSIHLSSVGHSRQKSFGLIFSASLFGLMLAAMASGPIYADRAGDARSPSVFSTVLFAIFSILTARATSYNEMLTYRFLTGLGLGGAMPNAVAIASEYSPKRLIPLFVAGLFAGMPLGGFICGAASSAMVPIWGWRSVFYLGGILPLVLALLAIKFLPESVRFLSAHGGDEKKIAKNYVSHRARMFPLPPSITPLKKSGTKAFPSSTCLPKAGLRARFCCGFRSS